MKVAQHRIGDAPKGGREGGLGRLGVGAYTQYLGIVLLKVRVGGPERGDLVRSAAGKREQVERQNDVLLSPVLA